MLNGSDDTSERLAALDPERSCIVQAPAGSGKTELLVQRMLVLLGRVERPGAVLAITFTRKAAAEMRTRLLEALSAAGSLPPETEHARRTWELAVAVLRRDRECGWDLLANPAQLAIQTIDSLNASLVRQLPLVSRLGGTPRIAEDPRPLYRRSVRTVLRHLAEPGSSHDAAAAQMLRHLDNRFERLAEMLESMLANRDQWLPLLLRHDAVERRAALEGALRSHVEDCLGGLYSRLPAEFVRELPPLVAFAAGNREEIDPDFSALAGLDRLPLPVAAELDAWRGLAGLLLTAAGRVRLRYDKRSGFPAGAAAAEAKERMLQLAARLDAHPGLVEQLDGVRALPGVTYSDPQWQIVEALVELLPRCVAELWLTFSDAGSVDFIEVALRALEALGSGDDPTDLMLRLDAGLQHLLVDEFQDTSRLQWRLLERLTAGWTPGDGRTLFLVGDPMQSIYRFREAEVGLFLQARNAGLGALRLEALTLSSNFRSRPALVEWVNRTLAGIFPAEEDVVSGAVRFAPALPRREALATAVRIHPFAGRDDRGEAEQVATLVATALDAGQRTAILVRSRNHLPVILQVLRERGLAYQGRDLDPLATRSAARDIAALTRALLHPADRLHWLALLRAPWCGLSLVDLQQLVMADPQRTLPELLADPAVGERLSTAGCQRLERLRPILQRATVSRGRIGLRHLVEGCWLALGGPLVVDPSGLADAQRVFELLESLDHGGDLASFRAFEEGLLRLFAAADPAADGRLQVMTIHKAKGLEFDCVIMPGLGRTPRVAEQRLLRWLDHPQHGLLLAPIAPLDGRSADPTYAAIGEIERRREQHEALRLLYVALTRAREELHLLGHARVASDGSCAAEPGSLLHKLWPVLGEDFGTRLVASPTRSSVVACGGLRRLPTDWALPALKAAPLPPRLQSVSPSHFVVSTQDSELFWVRGGEIGPMVGTEVHRWLELLARRATPGRVPDLPADFVAQVRRSLANRGLPGALLSKASAIVEQAVRQTVASERGRWILAPHPAAQSEYAVSGMLDGQLVHAVIDRTFVADGSRWVIDYKTSSPGKGDLDGFLSNERQRYQPQLDCYVRLLEQLDARYPVRAALYFPLCDGWILSTAVN